MKKYILLIVVLFVILSFSVSAGLFSGVWEDYLTGRQVKENKIPCEDSDGGLNYDTQGSIKTSKPYPLKYENVIEELNKKLENGQITKVQYDEAFLRFKPMEAVDSCAMSEEPAGTYAVLLNEGYCGKDGYGNSKTYNCLNEDKLCFDGRCEEPGKTGYFISFKYDLKNKISSPIILYGKTIYIKNVGFETDETYPDRIIYLIPEFVVDGVMIKYSDCIGPCEINGLRIDFQKEGGIDPGWVKGAKDNKIRIELIISPINSTLKESEPNLVIKEAKNEMSLLYKLYFTLFGKLPHLFR